MEMYALSITPLIRRLRSDEPSVKQVWCTYDSQVGGKINPLRRWWQCLPTAVPQMGYYPGASKTNLIVKPQFQEVAIKVFKGKGIKVTTKRQEMLGSTISATSLAEEYTSHKVKDFVEEIKNLSQNVIAYLRMLPLPIVLWERGFI